MFDINTSVDDYMSIVVTHECDRKCPFCVDQYRDLNKYISPSNVFKALMFAKEHNVRDILLVGGEPTMHPDIVGIAKLVKSYGFNAVLTTNYSKPDVVKKLDKYVDSFNISYYGQEVLPLQSKFSADLTLSTLIFKGQLDTKDELDKFIDKYKRRFILKFSTLTACNLWAKNHQRVSYLDSLNAEHMLLFNEIEGMIYRGCVIKRYDHVLKTDAKQSFKCHVDGTISNSWAMNDREILAV
jgi:organic radical activating enzyme